MPADPLSAIRERDEHTQPLYGQIRDVLRAQILDGRYAPGCQVPSESALGQTFSASRITVRQALGALQSEGLIYKVHGKGSFVSRPKAFQNVDSLQGFAEQLSTRGHEVLNRLLSLAHGPAAPAVAARLQLPEGAQATAIRRLRLVDRVPVSLELTWVAEPLGRRLAQADLATRDIFLILENDCGLALGHAELAIDAVPATAEQAATLQVPAGTPLLRIERLTHDRAGRPVDYEFLYFRCDTFQYRLRADRHAPTTAAVSRFPDFPDEDNKHANP